MDTDRKGMDTDGKGMDTDRTLHVKEECTQTEHYMKAGCKKREIQV